MTSSVADPQTAAAVPGKAARQALLRRVAGALACPRCRNPLTSGDGGSLSCAACGADYSERDGQFQFTGLTEHEISSDWLNRLKEVAKRRLGTLYPLALKIISPVYAPKLTTGFLRTFELERQLVVDLGSGASQYQDRVVCVDGYNYPNVHVVADLQRLPFQDNSLDGVISIAVLEHVAAPAVHVSEMFRVLRPEGRALCFVPFMQGYHASPHDYQRLTISGLRNLFREFEVVDVGVGAGPTSGMLWILQEWLAMVLSLGSLRLYRLLVPLMWLLSPLKFLDILLARHPAAPVIASGFLIEARKPRSGVPLAPTTPADFTTHE